MRIDDNRLKNDFKIILTFPNWLPKNIKELQGEHDGFNRLGAILFVICYYLGWVKIYRNGERIDFQIYVETVSEENKRT